MIGSLLLILGLIGLIYYLLRRFAPQNLLKPSGNEDLKIISTLPCGPKKSLLLVQFLNKKLLIGITENNITCLSEVNLDHEGKQDFSKILGEEKKHTSS
ncbi:MAG: flagellar biosynthetic protein FliO [Desulfonauticus sp.]|nr:flagellar biosynthetic protein FliO [Desulfonauticus sp.]